MATPEVADRLLEEYDELNRRFYLGDFRPSELSGGRFSEAAFRICENVCFSQHTALGRRLANVDQLIAKLEGSRAGAVDDTFRIHIPRALRLIYDLRNKRDVAHLGSGSVTPNFTDASLTIAVAGWVVADMVRVGHNCAIDAAQRIVDSLVQRHTPLVWQDADVLRVLNPSLSYRDQLLLLLYHLQPGWTDEQRLFEAVEYSQMTAFRRNILRPLHDGRLIEYRDGRAKILPPGINAVEASLRTDT